MKPNHPSRQRGFTLLETVIAIGVLAVLLTGFMVVFAPAAEGIRKSINVQQADRLTSALEKELVTVREVNSTETGFSQAFDLIKDSDKPGNALLVYEYRAKITGSLRPDGTPEPEPSLANKEPGKDYIVVPMVRKKNDTNLTNDLAAIEGALYLVKCTQLVFRSGQMVLGTPGTITDPTADSGGGGGASSSDDYPEAVIAFSADFHLLPARTASYVNSAAFSTKFNSVKNPVFSRNLAVRR